MISNNTTHVRVIYALQFAALFIFYLVSR